MFREHNFNIWGTYCECGNDCSILQNKYHPWDDTKFTTKLKCNVCGNELIVDKQNAQIFYNNKIFSYFNDIYGSVIDLGCGGGFLSQYLICQDSVDIVFELDIDKGCIDELSDLIGQNNKFEFMDYEGQNLRKLFNENRVEFLVNRDVFMFIEDTDQYFDDVSEIVNKGIRHMGWYSENNERMKNKLTPQQIKNEYSKRGWTVELKYLDWYKSGYFIDAYKYI